MREQDLWIQLHYGWRNKVHMTRVENTASFGMPDVNCCYQGVEFWIEHKIEKSDTVLFRPSQVAWLAARMKVQGLNRVFIVVGSTKWPEPRIYKASDIFTVEGALINVSSQVKLLLNKLLWYNFDLSKLILLCTTN